MMMSMIFGFVCLAGAISLFLACLPKAVKESGVPLPSHLKPACDCEKTGH